MPRLAGSKTILHGPGRMLTTPSQPSPSREKCTQRSGAASIPVLADLQEALVRSCSLDSVLFAEGLSILPDQTHFLTTQTCVLDRHAEECVFVVGRKGVLVEQHQFRVIRAGFREFGKLRSDGRDQAGLSLHALVIGHGAMRIADSEPVRVPQVENIPRRHSLRG